MAGGAGADEFWQAFEPAPHARPDPWQEHYLAPMRDGTVLRLPMRDFGETGLAGLIANQASFAVLDRLCAWIARDVAGLRAEIVVGLPTLGHAVGAGVARALGHANWVAPGTTRKLWYEEALSVPTASVTSPGAGRRIWLDPRLLPRLTGRRVLLVDDVISTGRSARAGLELLARAGVHPSGVAVAMLQGDAWRPDWDPALPLHAAFSTPRFRRMAGGWQPATP